MLLGLVGAIVALASPSVSRASFVVDPGYDLFQTDPGTSLDGVPLVGVPLGSFDFGSGAVPVYNTDTIVHRLDQAVAPGGVPGVAPPIGLEMVALQLRSAVPVNLGLGTGFYFETLQSARGGPASLGTMTITFGPEGVPHGTFNSLINVAYDIRLGSPTGPIAQSGIAPLTSPPDVAWSHFPPPLAVEIPGVNTFLNGTDHLADFWPVPFGEAGLVPPTTGLVPPTTIIHQVSPATVPEPASLVMFGIGRWASGPAAGEAESRRLRHGITSRFGPGRLGGVLAPAPQMWERIPILSGRRN